MTETYRDLTIYDNLHSELNIISNILNGTSLTELEKNEALLEYVTNTDFELVGLYAKAPRYSSGREVYQEFYSSKSPECEYNGLAVRENYEDIISDRELILPIQFVDDLNNSIYLGGNFTDEIFSGQTHEIVPDFSGVTVLASGDVISSVYVSGSDITIVTFSPLNLSGVTIGNQTKFVNGSNLTGIRHIIHWYSKSGTILVTKSFSSNFEKFEAAVREYDRRQKTVNQLISSADGTAIQPFVKAIYEHYKYPYIVDYIDLGDHQGWKDAIDQTTTGVINDYLEIVIPFTNIENETVYKKIRDYIKDELYVGYK